MTSKRNAHLQTRTALYTALFLSITSVSVAQVTATGGESSRKLEAVQVTATRVEESVDRIPVAMTVISSEQLRERGARNLTQALALVAGVEISQGGDGGPAGSVPSFMGLREFDAFLLVVDGIPYGGAYNPQLTVLDMNNVERIEVMRGAAPVTYGSTSFVGVIHVIHYAAGQAPNRVAFGGGHRSSGYAQGAYNLNDTSTLSFNLDRRNLADKDAGFESILAQYRSAFELGEGKASFDASLARVAQDPNSPVVREGPRLTNQTPLNGNHNPSDANITERRFQLNGSYSLATTAGDFLATAAFARTTADVTRGFLTGLGRNPAVTNAAGYRQDRTINDVYLNAQLSNAIGERGHWSVGADYMGGSAKANNELFSYYAPLSGQNRARSSSFAVTDRPEAENERNFFGIYGQADWAVTDRFDVLAGVRVNSTREKQDGETEVNGVTRPASGRRNTTRATGHIGASYRLYESGEDFVSVYADYRNSFKPAANDFGPEAQANVLETEDSKAAEFGIKQRWFDGALDLDFSAYQMDFDNLVVPQNVNGRPGLTNAGKLNLDGYEVEGQWHALDYVGVYGAWAYHKAVFGDYQRLFGTTLTQLRGKNQEMTPRNTRALGVVLGADTGVQASIVYSYVGERFLNKRNTAPVGDYETLDASVGWRFGDWTVRVTGSNLADKRPPTAESELGDAQYYLLPARHVEAGLEFSF
jgi:iron complex outermembrane recepter protein